MISIDFELCWSSLPSPALVINVDLVILHANVAAETFLNMSVNQMLGREFGEFAGEASRLLEGVAYSVKGHGSLTLHDLEFNWRDLPLTSDKLEVTPVDGAADQFLLIFTQRQIANSIDRSLASRDAARSMSGMAAMLAHEIRNPLAGISGASQLLAMSVGEEDRNLASMIEMEAARIDELVKRVEVFGNMGPPQVAPVNIHDILRRAVVAARAGFAAHAKIEEIYDPSLPDTIGDADQLSQVMQNLLKNAAEVIDGDDGEITIKTAYRPGVQRKVTGAQSRILPLEIEIIDNGPGVPDDLLPSIFEPFVSSKNSGQGLGLSLAAKVLSDHDGTIGCARQGGKTVFRINLPVLNEQKG